MDELRIAQYFILTSSGEAITYHSLSGNLTKTSISIFNSKFVSSTPNSVFSQNGVTYFWTKNQMFYYVITTLSNCSPFVAADFLDSSIAIFKDYLGSLTEDSLRSNFFLIYELLAEICTFGFIQESHNKQLKAHIVGKPISTDGPGIIDKIRDKLNTNSRSSGSANRSILESRLNLLTGSNYTNSALEAPSNMMNTNRSFGRFTQNVNLPKASMPTGLSRKAGLGLSDASYINNEIFLDLYETIECIIDKDGNDIVNRVVGQVFSRSFLFQPVSVKILYTKLKVLSLSDIPPQSQSDFTESKEESFKPSVISSNSDIKWNREEKEEKKFFTGALGNLNFSRGEDPVLANPSIVNSLNTLGVKTGLTSKPKFNSQSSQNLIDEVKEIKVDNAYTKLVSNPHEGSKTMIPLDHFNKGEYTYLVPEGEHLLFEYCLDNSDKYKANVEKPITVTTTLNEEPRNPNAINLIVIIACNLPSQLSVNNVEMEMLVPPTKLIGGVSCRYMVADEKYSFDYYEEDSIISWKIKSIKGGQKDVAKFIINLNLPEGNKLAREKLELIKSNLPCVRVRFDCNGYLPTGFKIRGMVSESGVEVKKWVRYHTVCETFEKRLS